MKHKFDIFIRFGGLSSVNQRGYDSSMPTYHSPPKRRGIYAFPLGQIEQFLLGTDYFNEKRMKWVLDKNGNRIPPNDENLIKFENGFWIQDYKAKREWRAIESCYKDDIPDSVITKYVDENPPYLAKMASHKKFKYVGNVWHHLDCKESDILEKKGDWVLTTHSTFVKALKKRVIKNNPNSHYRSNVSPYPTSKDDLEVFIEKV